MKERSVIMNEGNRRMELLGLSLIHISMPIIDFKAAMCKHCYKCVRDCEVKSIMIRDGHAYIMPNRCILCGQCLISCPQSAKKMSSELEKVKSFIKEGRPVILSLSSAYIGLFQYKTRGQVKEDVYKRQLQYTAGRLFQEGRGLPLLHLRQSGHPRQYSWKWRQNRYQYGQWRHSLQNLRFFL